MIRFAAVGSSQRHGRIMADTTYLTSPPDDKTTDDHEVDESLRETKRAVSVPGLPFQPYGPHHC